MRGILEVFVLSLQLFHKPKTSKIKGLFKYKKFFKNLLKIIELSFVISEHHGI